MTLPAASPADFPNLDAMREAHAGLLRELRQEKKPALLLGKIMPFLASGQATGARLSREFERTAAQAMLDYWQNTAYRAGKSDLDDVPLADFDPAATARRSLEPSDFRRFEEVIFQSRKKVLADCLQTLQNHRRVMVVNAISRGLSTFMNKLLLPYLRDGALPAGKHHYLPVVTPGVAPLRNLASILAQELGGDAVKIETQLRSNSRTLKKLLAKSGSKPVVLAIDDAEELFTRCGSAKDAGAFMDNLRELFSSKGFSGYVLLACDGELAQKFAEHHDKDGTFQRARVTLPPVDTRDLRDAIEDPARSAGIEFDQGLAAKIVDDIQSHPASPVLLQMILKRLWKNIVGNHVTWANYNQIGGRQFIDRLGEEVYGSPQWSDDDRKLVEKIFRHLLSLGVDNRVISTPSPRDRLVALAPNRVPALLQTLQENDLLHGSVADQTVQVIDRDILAQWGRLRKWLQHDSKHKGSRRLFASAADKWVQNGQQARDLARGALLAEAADFTDLTASEDEYLKASQREQIARARTERRNMLRLIAGLVIIAGLLAGLASFWYFTYQKEKRLRIEEQAKQDAAQSLLLLKTNFPLAVEKALDAYAKGPHLLESHASLLQVVESNPQLERIFHDSAAALHTLAFDRQGKKLLAAGGEDKTISLYDVETNKRVGKYGKEHHTGAINALAFSPDGRLLVSADDKGVVVFWDITGMEPRFRLKKTCESGAIHAIAFNAQGDRLLAGGAEGMLYSWRINAGIPAEEKEQLANPERSPIKGIVFPRDEAANDKPKNETPTDKNLFVIAYGKVLELRDHESLKAIDRNESQHRSYILYLGFAPTKNTIVSVSVEMTALWNVTGKNINTKRTYEDLKPPNTLRPKPPFVFSPSGQRVAAVYANAAIHVLANDPERTVQARLFGHTLEPKALIFRDDDYLFSAGEDGKIYCWNLKRRGVEPPPKKVPVAADLGLAFSSLAFHPTDDVLSAGTTSGQIYHWDLKTGEARGPLGDRSFKAVAGLAYALPGNKLLAAGGSVTKAEGVAYFAEAQGIALSPDRAVAAHFDVGEASLLFVNIHDPQKKVGRTEINLGFPTIGAIALGQDQGRYRLAAAVRDDVRIWDLPAQESTALPPISNLRCVALRPDGKLLAAGTLDGALVIWDLSDVAKPQLKKKWKPHDGVVRALAFSPDGQTLASVSYDGTVALQSATDLTSPQIRMRGHTDTVISLAFDAAGKILATGSTDGTIRLWEVARGQPYGAPLNLQGVHGLAFVPGTRELLVARREGALDRFDTSNRFGWPALSGYRGPGGVALHQVGSITGVAIHPTGSFVAAGANRNVLVWRGGDRAAPVALPAYHQDTVHGLAFHSQKNILATGDKAGRAAVWDLDTRERLWTLDLPQVQNRRETVRDVTIRQRFDQRWGCSVAIHPKTGLLAATRTDHAIFLGDPQAKTFRLLQDPTRGHRDDIWSLAFHPVYPWLASSGADKKICLWDAALNPEPLLFSANHHADLIRTVVFSADGAFLASGSADGEVILWEVSNREQKLGFLGRLRASRDIISLAFSSDNQIVTAGCADGSIHAWDVSLNAWWDRAYRLVPDPDRWDPSTRKKR